ncbi:MAB_1171c family putative transporter [Streptomyces sp. RK9]|uniref:MAB_1171c family putative transporter n=1 Tax=Streptomyces sp. RK9 TaxID=3239284 RepID=UPI00386E7935
MNAYALHSVGATAAWLAFGYKLTALRKAPRDYALVALCGTLLFSAISYTVAHPRVYVPVDRLLGFPNAAALVAMGCVVLGLAGQQFVLTFWAHPHAVARRRARPRVLAAAVVLLALLTLFPLAEPSEQRPKDFALYYLDNPPFAAFLSIYFLYFIWGEVAVARMSHAYAKVSHRLWLRRGLYLVALGSWLTLSVSLSRAFGIALAALSVDLDAVEPALRVLGDLGALIMYVGWTLPGWGPILGAPGRHLRARRQYRRLRPLRNALHEFAPTIELPAYADGFWHRLRPSHLEFQVYRQVIEIRDCQLALRPYADPGAVRVAGELGRAAGLGARQVLAVQEATRLASMVRSCRRRTVPDHQGAPPTATGPEGSGLADEIDWLVTVAEAMERSPQVAAALAASRAADRTGVRSDVTQ